MFDGVSYEKGGRILHMLRNYLGDSAFFKGLNLYLTTNKFKNGEAHQLRLAMEEISGRDLNWFFNEWYFNNGHPDVDIRYEWLADQKMEKVTITQKQTNQIFQFPLAIDVYNGETRTRHQVWVKDTVASFLIPAAASPNLVNVDGDKIMLWKKDDAKTAAEYVYQYGHAGLYLDRKEALDYGAAHFDSSAIVHTLMINGLKDKSATLRKSALGFWKKNAALLTDDEEKLIYAIAQTDVNMPVRAAAIDVLSADKNAGGYEAFFTKSTTDSSYSIAGASLEALIAIDPQAAEPLENKLKKDAEGRLKTSLAILAYTKKDDLEADSVVAQYKRMNFAQKAQNQKGIMYYAAGIEDVNAFKTVMDPIIEAYKANTPDFGGTKATTKELLRWLVGKKETVLKASPNNEKIKEQVAYLKEKEVY